MPGPGLVMVIFLPTWGSSVRPREKPLLTIPLQPSVSFTPFSAVSKSLGTLFSDGDPEAPGCTGGELPTPQPAALLCLPTPWFFPEAWVARISWCTCQGSSGSGWALKRDSAFNDPQPVHPPGAHMLSGHALATIRA